MANLPLTDQIYWDLCQITLKSRVLKAQFGDGYDQTAPDGINSNVREWKAVYKNVNDTDKQTLDTFLRLVGQHTSFNVTIIGDSASSRWKITGEVGYEIVATVPRNVWSVTFTATEVFV